MTTLTLAAALGSGLRRALEDDPTVVLLGEDIGRLGGVFRVTDGLQRDFGDRVMDTPLAEAGILGVAVGLAYRGFRPVVEIQFDGFCFPAVDQIVTQVSRLHYRTGGAIRMPITVRIPYGGGIGAVEHHSESPEAYFAHTPGLRVVTCGGPQDAHTMLRQAIASDDPVIFLEPKRRYWVKDEVDESLNGALALDRARVVVEGTDVTLAAYGPLVLTLGTKGCRSRSSTCGRCRRWTSTRSRRPCARPAGSSSRTRPSRAAGSARRSRQASPSGAGMCCGHRSPG
jgi:2-oxoisovalerate dehydrogenase E1 component beta subunit